MNNKKLSMIVMAFGVILAMSSGGYTRWDIGGFMLLSGVILFSVGFIVFTLNNK